LSLRHRPSGLPSRIPKQWWKWLKTPGRYPGPKSNAFWRWRAWRLGLKIPKPLKPKPRYVDVQGCPVPRQLAAVIQPSLAATGAMLISCYRGSDPQGAAILHVHGKHTQEQLYEGWLRRLPGFNPANRPGTSTHELRSDSIAYPGPTGRKLEWWQCGMDIDDGHVDAFIRSLAGRGVNAHRPYGFGAEYHHVNLKTLPPRRLWIGR